MSSTNGKREPGSFICVDKAIIVRAMEVGPAAALLYVMLEGYADKGRKCFPSMTTLGKQLKFSRRHIQQLMRKLETAGIVTKEPRVDGSGQTSNLYYLPLISPVNQSAPRREPGFAGGANGSAQAPANQSAQGGKPQFAGPASHSAHELEPVNIYQQEKDPVEPDSFELEGLSKDKPSCRSKTDRSAEVLEVFEHYRSFHPRAHRNPTSTSKEWKAIRARLKEGYTVDDLKAAIDGCHRSPFHMGENKNSRKYDSLELIVRDSSKVTQFMEVPEHAAVLTETDHRNARAVEQFSRVPAMEEMKD